MAIPIEQYPAAFKRGLESARGKEFKLVSLAVLDSFSHAGSRNAYNGSKLTAVIDIDGQNVTFNARCGLKGNSRDIVHGLTLTKDQDNIIDSFWESELWLSYAERCPNNATICLGYHLTDTKLTAYVTLTTKRGVEATLEMFVAAPDTAIIARSLGVGVGQVVSDKAFNSLMDAIVKSRDESKTAKAAA